MRGAWPDIQIVSNPAAIVLVVRTRVCSFGYILAEQPVGFFAHGPALSGCGIGHFGQQTHRCKKAPPARRWTTRWLCP